MLEFVLLLSKSETEGFILAISHRRTETVKGDVRSPLTVEETVAREERLEIESRKLDSQLMPKEI